MRDSIQADLETKPYPTKKRGVIWLVTSIVLFGGALIRYILLALFYAVRNVMGTVRDAAEGVVVLLGHSGFGAHAPHQLSRLELCANLLVGLTLVLSYLGIWYGAMLLVGAYKKYSFNKVRLLTILLAISFAITVLFTMAYISVDIHCETLRISGDQCPPLPMPIFIQAIENVQTWINVLVY
jgi:hypothetical protein